MKTEGYTKLYSYTVTITDIPGRLAQLTDVLSKNAVNISNISIYPAGNFGFVNFTTPAPHKIVTSILEKSNFVYQSSTVYSVSLPNKPGALNRLLKSIAAHGYNINAVSATTFPDAEHVNVIIIPSVFPPSSAKAPFEDVLQKSFGRVPVA